MTPAELRMIGNDYGEIKMRRGRWFMIKSVGEAVHELWHQCDKKNYYDLDYATYQVRSYSTERPIIPNWRCGCGSIPPDSIVTCWRLLEPEHTCTEIEEALKYDKEWAKEAAPDGRDDLWEVMYQQYNEWVLQQESHMIYDIGDFIGS